VLEEERMGLLSVNSGNPKHRKGACRKKLGREKRPICQRAGLDPQTPAAYVCPSSLERVGGRGEFKGERSHRKARRRGVKLPYRTLTGMKCSLKE